MWNKFRISVLDLYKNCYASIKLMEFQKSIFQPSCPWFHLGPTSYQSIDLLIACDISDVAEHIMDWPELNNITKHEADRILHRRAHTHTHTLFPWWKCSRVWRYSTKMIRCMIQTQAVSWTRVREWLWVSELCEKSPRTP